VVLICEDETDGIVARRLAELLCPTIRIDYLPAGGCGEIKRKLDKLVADARRDLGKRGCVAVLLDGDQKNPARDEPHRSIALGCQKLRVPFIPCLQDMEAWLLTDPGCRAYLKLPSLKGTTDGLAKTKAQVAAAYYKVCGRSYEKRLARRKLADKLSGPSPQANRSLAEALRQLQACVPPPTRHDRSSASAR
jgi:hypothetical protein